MRAQGIGGVFLYSSDPETLATWYAERFDLTLEKWGDTWGCELPGADREPSDRKATTTFAVFRAKGPTSGRRVTVNWRVPDLEAAVEELRAAGCEVNVAKGDEYGRFARTVDPDGNGVELWEPPHESTQPPTP